MYRVSSTLPSQKRCQGRQTDCRARSWIVQRTFQMPAPQQGIEPYLGIELSVDPSGLTARGGLMERSCGSCELENRGPKWIRERTLSILAMCMNQNAQGGHGKQQQQQCRF
jgi:hypothetical protein